MVEEFGSFVPELFGRGEFWRAVTAHFLHGAPSVPIHLAVNVGGLLALGHLVERPLGSLRTVVVLALGALGTILGSLYYGYDEVIGSSGLVSALAGAILALELHYPERVPAQWRLPRRLFVWALVIQFVVIDQIFSSFLAGGAHLGGFAGGYLATWLLANANFDDEQAATSLRVAALASIMVLVVGIFTAVPLIRHDMGALERHALRLLNTQPAVNAKAIQHDNAVAWFIATEGEPTPGGLDLAVALADRAVAATGRRNANILDTLAEALFRAGDRLAALLTIDEAIRLAPAEPYFREQRRRYTGERDAEDRPAPPGDPVGGDAESPDDDRLVIDPEAPAISI
jgi:membrane associated rhomboid family serine protease